MPLLKPPRPAAPALLCSMEAAKAELLTALDEAERQSGGELSGSNDKGWEVRGRGRGREGGCKGGCCHGR